jgi:hypothetical protein
VANHLSASSVFIGASSVADLPFLESLNSDVGVIRVQRRRGRLSAAPTRRTAPPGGGG